MIIVEKEILKTIKYFSVFSYAPSFDEIYTFLPVKTTKQKLQKTLDILSPHTLGEYSKFLKKKAVRTRISLHKIQKIKKYIKILSFFPQIKLVGLSGTLAMHNAGKDDDIDLFVITAENRLWMGRFIALLLAQLMRLRRKRNISRAKDKICLNLFFEESNLNVPNHKKTEYVAHEILQLKPLINKNDTYRYFLRHNDWVFKRFPNAKKLLNGKTNKNMAKFKDKQNLVSKLLNFIEYVLKTVQLNIIKQHQTSEIITDTQLWFFPEDFEKKLNSKLTYLEESSQPRGR